MRRSADLIGRAETSLDHAETPRPGETWEEKRTGRRVTVEGISGLDVNVLREGEVASVWMPVFVARHRLVGTDHDETVG